MSISSTQLAGVGAPALSLPIEGMTCASCVGRVEAALRKVEGVGSVTVNLATERAEVRPSRDGAIDRAALVQAIERAGYDVPLQTVELSVEGMTCASCSRISGSSRGRLTRNCSRAGRFAAHFCRSTRRSTSNCGTRAGGPSISTTSLW